MEVETKEFLKAINKLAMQCVVKALKINLETGEYKIIHLDKGENKCNSSFLNDWVEESIMKELINPDYAEAVKHIVNVNYINKTLKYNKYIHLKFKRMPYVNGEYKYHVLTILPENDENKFAYLIIYDID